MTLRDAVSRAPPAEMEIVVICLCPPQARPAQTLTFKYVFSPQSALKSVFVTELSWAGLGWAGLGWMAISGLSDSWQSEAP